MSRKSDPGQGMVADPARQRGHKVPDPDGKAILRGIQPALNKVAAAETRQRPAQKVTGKQDWRRG